MSKVSKGFDVAIVGATGMVGEAVCELLQQQRLPVNHFYLLASENTAGERVSFNGKYRVVKPLDEFDFSRVQIAIFCTPDEVSTTFVPKAVEAGCTVLDNSQCYVDDDDVPLVIAGVNDNALDMLNQHRKIVANPDSIVIQLWTVLKPIYDLVGIKKITVATYQAVSGQGKHAIETLAKQTVSVLNGQGAKTDNRSQQIAFNLQPVIGKSVIKGHSSTELQFIRQSQRIIIDPKLQLSATCVQVPVFHGDSLVVHIEISESIGAEKVIDLLKKNNKIKVLGDLENSEYATPLTSSKNGERVFVSRIRNDLHSDYGLNMWIVGDDIRNGMAMNIVQIAEKLIKYHL